MNEPGQEQQEGHAVTIPVEWYVPDSIQSRYASNVFVQGGQYEITLSFFETRLPILTGTPEENEAAIKKLGAIRAECVARVIIDPELVPKLIEALQKGMDGYLAMKRAEETEDNK